MGGIQFAPFTRGTTGSSASSSASVGTAPLVWEWDVMGQSIKDSSRCRVAFMGVI